MLKLRDVEAAHIHYALQAANWNKREAARALGISRDTLYRKIAEHALKQQRRTSHAPAVHEPKMTTLATASRPSVAGHGLRSLPQAARWYVCATIAVGAMCAGLDVPRVDLSEPLWLGAVLLVGMVTATIHLPLPLARGQSSMSVSHSVVIFTLLTMGTGEAVVVAAMTTLIQSTVRKRSRRQPYQILFNIASLVITVTLAGVTFFGLRVEQGNWLDTFAGPLALAEVVYFGANTALIATAVALTSRRSPLQVWLADFLWTSPGYFVGAAVAGTGVAMAGQRVLWWIAIAVPLLLTYRAYQTYLNRVKAGEKNAEQALEIQFAIVKALTAAIESKDRTSQIELQRLTLCTEALGQAAGTGRVGTARAANGGAAARYRESRRA